MSDPRLKKLKIQTGNIKIVSSSQYSCEYSHFCNSSSLITLIISCYFLSVKSQIHKGLVIGPGPGPDKEYVLP